MGIPVLFSGQSLINAVVEIFVVGKNDMTTDIVKLANGQRDARDLSRPIWCDSQSLLE